ncbi:MAG: ATP-binding protein [Desulfobacteraceae bacterium]|jgi:ATP-dependent DNA helicase RecG
MKKSELNKIIKKGEDSRLQFKVDVRNADTLAAEMVAFSNSEGGLILVGVSDSEPDLIKLLQNMNLATDDGHLNLACVLLFAERPEWIKPQFIVKAIMYPGNEIHVSDYMDTEDFSGPLQKIFEDSMAFVMRNLHKVQAGRGVNAPGLPEIPETVFEELLVNALIHRDYMVSATIRLFIFDNRIEIISPGHLPNNLTVEKIRAGNCNIRNPILVSFITKGILPYHGLGSGIKRALEKWPDIEFKDDRENCLFTVIIHRKPLDNLKDIREKVGEKVGEKLTRNQQSIIQEISNNPNISARELAEIVGITSRKIEENIKKLKNMGVLKRIGPAKGHKR